MEDFHADRFSGPPPRRRLTDIEADGSPQARAADREAAIGAHRGARGRAAARWSICAPTTISASPIIPRSPPRRERRSTATASAWPRCGSSAARRTCTASSSSAIAAYLGKDDAILFAACFDANGGIFEPLLGPRTTPSSPTRSTTPRSSTACGCARRRRYRYANSDMDELESRAQAGRADGARFRLIVTDGVFSMDGYVAKLPEICALAEKYGALVMVDDCHATGISGDKGKGTPALTGAGDGSISSPAPSARRSAARMGGFVAAAQPIIDLLRQRARPYLFSNSLAPPVVAGSLKAHRDRRKGRRSARQAHAAMRARFRDGLAAGRLRAVCRARRRSFR